MAIKELYNESDTIAQKNYQQYQELYDNDHVKAFDGILQQISPMFLTGKSRFIQINLFSLISHTWSNLLFEEFPRIQANDPYNPFVEKLTTDSKFQTILYENAIASSYNGDCFLKIRADDGTLIIEDHPAENVSIEYHGGNPRLDPIAYHLHFYKKHDDKYYVLRESHYKGRIESKAYELPSLQSKTVKTQAPLSIFGDISPVVTTNVDDFLVFHIKNVGKVGSIRGVSDYQDIMGLILSLENRISRNEDILDRHGKPILIAPTDTFYQYDPETGKKKKLNKDDIDVVEIERDADGKVSSGDAIKYLTWDAQLEATFKQIDKLIELVLMVAQVAPTLVGLNPRGGIPESGTALRYRILQTISRKNQKKLYWDKMLKRLFETAILYAKAKNLSFKETFIESGTNTLPEIQITWYDGVLKDERELTETEAMKVEKGFSTQVDSIAIVQDMLPAEAEAYKKKIDAEKKEKLEQKMFNLGNMHPNQVETRSARRTDEEIEEDDKDVI